MAFADTVPFTKEAWMTIRQQSTDSPGPLADMVAEHATNLPEDAARVKTLLDIRGINDFSTPKDYVMASAYMALTWLMWLEMGNDVDQDMLDDACYWTTYLYGLTDGAIRVPGILDETDRKYILLVSITTRLIAMTFARRLVDKHFNIEDKSDSGSMISPEFMTMLDASFKKYRQPAV